MSRVERDPERGRATAAKLKALGAKGILIKAAEQGYITQLACRMPECFCPEELGGACYFEPVTKEWRDWRSDWMPIPGALPGLQERRRQGGRGQRHPGAPPLQSPRSLFKGWPFAREGSREDQESPQRRRSRRRTKKAPERKSLPDAEKAQYLLDHQTISDRTWTDEPRLKGEKRDAFIRRILGFRRRLNADPGGLSLGGHPATLAQPRVLYLTLADFVWLLQPAECAALS
jgi:hypothetical protein